LVIKHSTTVTDGVDKQTKAKWEAAHTIEDDTIIPANLVSDGAPAVGKLVSVDPTDAGKFSFVSESGLGDMLKSTYDTDLDGKVETADLADNADLLDSLHAAAFALSGHTHAQLHDRSHSLIGTADHTSTVTVNKHFKADASGLPVEGANTDAEIAAAVSAAHAAVTLGTDADILLGLSSQQLIFDTQMKNLVLAGPATGVDAKPTFRSLASADIPDISGTYSVVGHTQAGDKQTYGTAANTACVGNDARLSGLYIRYLFNHAADYPYGAVRSGVAGRNFLCPIFVPRTITFDAVAMAQQADGGAGTHFRLGLYGSTAAGIPDTTTRLLDTGDINAVALAWTWTETAISDLQLAKGKYWMDFETEDTVITWLAASGENNPSSKMLGCYFNQTYGALPTPCPTTTDSGTARWLGYLRVKSVDD
jgi:hypothetical protein